MTEMCPICLDEFNSISVTVCGHKFCEKCLSESITRNPTCPLCRTIIVFEQFYEIIDEEDEEETMIYDVYRPSVNILDALYNTDDEEEYDENGEIYDDAEAYMMFNILNSL